MTEYCGRFTGKTAEYARYRERYDPEIALPILREWCGLEPEWTVADVGAGTGMVGDLFRANGNRVLAIEPNAEMRSACAGLHATDEMFAVIDGTAEKTGLPDASFEMIAVGRALHWFDVDRALAEFRRILKPQGWVAILACGRAEDGREENRSYKEFMQARTGRDMYRDPLLAVYNKLETIFADGQFFHADVNGEMKLSWEELRGLTLSLSHSPMPGSDSFQQFESGLRNYFDRYEQNGQITLATLYSLNAGRLAE